MSTLILTARDPLRAGDGAHPLRTAMALAQRGEPVTVALLEDAVSAARLGHRDLEVLIGALDAGVEVLVERDAVARRAVQPAEGITVTDFPELAQRLESDRSVWL